MSDSRVTASDESLRTLGARPPFYRDATVVRWIAQVGTLALVLGALWFLAAEAGDSLRASGAQIDFDFISDHIGIKVGSGIDTSPDTGGRALFVGMVNTIRMAAAGIALASVIGVLVGLARLSSNWPVRRLAGMYVEGLRNIPLLVQILVYAAVLTALPNVSFGMGPIPGWVHLSNKGLSVPRVFVADGFYQWAVILLIGAVIAHFVFRRLATKREMTGAQTQAGALGHGNDCCVRDCWLVRPSGLRMARPGDTQPVRRGGEDPPRRRADRRCRDRRRGRCVVDSEVPGQPPHARRPDAAH